MKQPEILMACFLGVITAGIVNASAQTNAYRQTNLVSDLPNTAAHLDPNLVNPWGLALIPGKPFFIADNHRGLVRTYDAQGNDALPVGFAILVPAGDASPATPAAVVINQTHGFILDSVRSQVLIATEDGTVSGWASVNGDFPSFATQAIDNSRLGAVYKGLAVLTPDCCAPFLAVTNFHSGLIEPYTQFFDQLAPPGSFTDPTLPAGYAPFGIQVLGKHVFVTYAVQGAKKRNPVAGAGNGVVSIFDLEGNFLKRFASHGNLNAPWGVVRATANFGQFSNAILIGNFGDGTINAFDPGTGKFLGRLKDKTGKVIVNSGLWGLTFGKTGTGDPNTLYFTAGPNQGRDGLFGAITASE